MMRRLALFITLVALLPSCSPSSEKADSAAADTTLAASLAPTGETEIAGDPQPPAPDFKQYNDIDSDFALWADSLSKYFQVSQIDLLNRAVREYKAITTASDLAHFYQVTLRDSIAYMISKEIEEAYRDIPYEAHSEEDWDWFQQFFPFIGTTISCYDAEGVGMECIHYAPINLLPLRALASRTPETEDDLFFDGMIKIWNNPGEERSLIVEVLEGPDDYEFLENLGCDWCTTCRLGEGHHAGILQVMEDMGPARKLFDKAMSKDIGSLLSLLTEHPFYYPKATVLEEIDRMIASGTKGKLMTPDELTSLREVRGMINEREGGFNCREENCDYGDSPFEH